MRSMRPIIIALTALLTACQPPTSSEERNLIVRGDRLFVAATIEGSTCEALLDSAAEMTLVDSTFAATLGLATFGFDTAFGTGGQAEVAFAEGVAIETAGIALDDLTVAVVDLSDIADRLVGAPVPAVIGRELFDAARLEIDIQKGIIRKVSHDPTPSGERLEMETLRGVQTIPVRVDGGAPVRADFDLGNGSEVLVGESYAQRMGLLAPDRIVGRKSGGGIGGEIERDLVVLRTLEIGGSMFRDVPAAIDRTENAADVNVGVAVLRSFAMTVDFAANTLWLKRLD